MTESGHGLQIVDVKDHKHILHEEDLKSLLMREDVKDLPVVVVSVAGAARGGKSFLLNFFVRYLASSPSAQKDGSWLSENSEPLAGFQSRSGIDPTTMGILMWSTPFISTLPSGDKVAILLVDTQGTFDSRSTVRDNSTIFALSTLVSSIQIYNLSHDIMEDDLQHLELFTEYSKLVNSSGSNSKAFQVLEFLVRDWQFPEDYPYGTVGGDRLLRKKLEITEDLAKEMKELRQHIWSSFDKVSCFLMPHPGFKVLKKTFNGNIKDLDSEFRMQLIDLINSIFGPEKLLPKTVNGELVKARDLFNYVKSYMELLNSDKIPSPTSFLAATVKAGLLSAVSESREIYERGMDFEVGTNKPSVPAADLVFLHKKYVAAARDAFNKKKKMGSAREAAEYLDTLSEELANRLPQFLQSNLSKIQYAINKAKESYEDAIQNISKEQPLCVHPKDLERIHNEGVSAAIRTYDAALRRATQKNDDERAKFIQGFEKQYALLRRTNEQNNNIAVTALGMEYWKRMMTKANQKPPLSDAAFRDEHDAAVVQVLKEFDSKRNIPNQYTEDVFKFNLTKKINEEFRDLQSIHNGNQEFERKRVEEEQRRIELERQIQEQERRRREWERKISEDRRRREQESSCSML